MSGLCGNPDCGAFLDRPGVPHLDRDTGRAAILCFQCANDESIIRDTKYTRLAIPPDEPPTKGTSE